MSDAASLLVAWQLNRKVVLIVGAGQVASSRLESVLITGAFIRIIAPSSDGLHPLIVRLLAENPSTITHYDRKFSESDLGEDVDMVLTAIDDVETSQRIAQLCRDKRIPINAADIPPSCDFYFGSQIRRGPLQVMVSTNGKGPKLANIVRRRLEDALPIGIEETINNVGILRAKLRSRAPGVGGELSQRRMKWMSNVCTQWELEELAQLNHDLAEKLLDLGWEKDEVPSFAAIADSVPSRSRAGRDLTHQPWILPFLTGMAVGICGFILFPKRR